MTCRESWARWKGSVVIRVTDAGTQHAFAVKPLADSNAVTESLKLNETLAVPVAASVLMLAFQ